MLTPKFEEFLQQHRWAVLTTLRTKGSPVSSMVAYACEGSEIVVSTPGATFKRRSIEADPRVNLCAISNQEPFNFVALEGRAVVQTDTLEPSTIKVFEAIKDMGYELPDPLNEWLVNQKRVILRITPDKVHGVIR